MECGIARRCITPERPIYLAGYAARTEKSEGHYQDIYVKALAIRENGSGDVAVIVTSDLLYFDDAILSPVEKRLEEECAIPPEQVFFTASHTHCGPIVRQKDGLLYGALDEEYLDFLREALFEVVRDATERFQTCSLRHYRARENFSVNRRVLTDNGVEMLANSGGIIDRDVDIVTARGDDGAIRAVFFGFACHPTTMGGYYIGGDYPGFAQRVIQNAYPGAEALFVQGCSGDIRPNNTDPESGRFKSGPIELVEAFGRRLGRAVLQAIEHEGVAVEGPVRVADEIADLPLQPAPSREDIVAVLDDTSPFRRKWARNLLDAIDRGDELPSSVPTHIQSLQIGDSLSLVAIAGEVCVEIALRIKEFIGSGPRFVLGYTNRVHWYIPSKQIVHEGGYEADSYFLNGIHSPYDGRVEDIIVDTVKRMLGSE